MKFNILSFLCLWVLLSSCNELSTFGSPTETIISPPPSASPTSQSESTPNQEAAGFLSRSICPANREVSLSNLGLSSRMNLVVLPLDATIWGDVDIAYSILSPNASEEELITEIAPPKGWMNRNYTISEDGKWVSFIRWETENFSNRELLVSSLDGSKQIVVMKLPNIYTHSSWLSNNKLAITGVFDPDDQSPPSYLYVPIKVIDPFSLEEQTLLPLPDEDMSRDQLFVFTENQLVYNLYSLGHSPIEKFILYDYANDLSYPVFQWLAKRDDLSLINLRAFYVGNSFSVVVTRPYGLDVSLDLDLNALKSYPDYEHTMNELVLPKEILPITVYAWIHSTNSLLLSETNKDIDNPKPLEFYSLDYNDKLLKNYCLQIPTNLDGIFPSPDGHFVAFSSQANNSLKGGITVLNLDTGFITIIEEFHMIGWGSQ